MGKSKPGIVLGTMEFGRGPCVNYVPEEMVQLCLETANNKSTSKTVSNPEVATTDDGVVFNGVDTAYMYTGGQSETILGEIDQWKGGATQMATKINPWDGKNFGAESVRQQVETSLKRLKVDHVDIMYLHAPDHATPLEETLATMDKLHREGKFSQLGLSNYSAWLVNEVVNLCKANNWIKPTIYQGMYSAITRQVEHELIPCLRYHKIAFYAYSPLGGGILTGKYKFEQLEDNSMTTGRFNGVGGWKVDVYRGRYWKREHFSAIEQLKTLLQEHHPNENISVPEAAFRWIFNHSALDGSYGDSVILGASRVEQVRMNMELSKRGHLHENIVAFFDDWWKSTMHLCPSYLR